MKPFLCSVAIITVLSLATFRLLGQAAGGFVGGIHGLNSGQRAQMRNAFRDSAELTALSNKVVIAKKEAVDAVRREGSSEAAVREKIEAVAKIQTETALLRYRTGVKAILPSVSDEQKAWMSTLSGSYYYELLVGNAGAWDFRGGISTRIEELLGDSAEMTALSNKVELARQEAIQVALNKDATDAAVGEKVEAVASIQIEIAMLRYRTARKAALAPALDEQKVGRNVIPELPYNRFFVGNTSGLEVVPVMGGFGIRRGGNN